MKITVVGAVLLIGVAVLVIIVIRKLNEDSGAEGEELQ